MLKKDAYYPFSWEKRKKYFAEKNCVSKCHHIHLISGHSNQRADYTFLKAHRAIFHSTIYCYLAMIKK